MKVLLQEGYQADIAMQNAQDLASQLHTMANLQQEVVIDDRTKLSIGRRVQQAKQLGFPVIIVAGKSVSNLNYICVNFSLGSFRAVLFIYFFFACINQVYLYRPNNLLPSMK